MLDSWKKMQILVIALFMCAFGLTGCKQPKRDFKPSPLCLSAYDKIIALGEADLSALPKDPKKDTKEQKMQRNQITGLLKKIKDPRGKEVALARCTNDTAQKEAHKCILTATSIENARNCYQKDAKTPTTAPTTAPANILSP
jgi:hypothetical protein